jgi:hypothetical protein
LAQPALHPARRKVLESLRQYWSGLTVFVAHSEVPMDNNTAAAVTIAQARALGVAASVLSAQDVTTLQSSSP